MTVGAGIQGGQDSWDGIALIHTHFVCGGKGDVPAGLCDSFETGTNGIAKILASLLERDCRSRELVVGINGSTLGQGGVGFGNSSLLLLEPGNCFVQEGILLLIEEAEDVLSMATADGLGRRLLVVWDVSRAALAVCKNCWAGFDRRWRPKQKKYFQYCTV